MYPTPRPTYSPLEQTPEGSSCDDDASIDQSTKPSRWRYECCKKIIIGIVWLALGFCLGLTANRKPEMESEPRWSFTDGTASLIAVNEEDIKRSNKMSDDDWFNSTVEYGTQHGGGYMATMELFHQLHCLNMLRKAIHSDYYKKMAPLANGTRPHILKTHLDHCLEIIRQVISCQGDTGLITFHWVQGNPVAYPDFNTWHQCRDPEEILAWSKAREAPLKSQLKKGMFSNLIEMPHAP
ncbi:hypothetical protein Purlil1_5664 [Purpureocillium lilacinum]|uniref:Tat pathway signal sequence n=1 Tax=Purpureocillium lilacinum TaxID=33203 RepID=A0ABR0C286_PURLI|nr:hypothetical protein Purlil1_5664 [Purpureocillium lilacinum]